MLSCKKDEILKFYETINSSSEIEAPIKIIWIITQTNENFLYIFHLQALNVKSKAKIVISSKTDVYGSDALLIETDAFR